MFGRRSMKMRGVVWAYFVFWCIICVSGCHYNGHDDSAGSSVDGSAIARNRRTTTTTTGNPNVTVIGFFPNCIEQRLNQTAGNHNSSSTRRAWKGPVSYVIYHSRWYRNVNRTCWGINDTAECWINNIINVVRGQSRTLRAAQECVVDYYEEVHGSAYVVNEFPNGTTFDDAETCENIDPETFEQQLVPLLGTATPVDADDVAFTTEYIDDVLEFAKEDLYCPDCSCDDLAETDEYFETFEFENECSSCWYTTFATEIDDDTELRDEISGLAFEAAGFTQKQTCPVDYDMDFSSEDVLEDLLRINISCGVDMIVIDMMSCGLVQLGYRKADEVFVTNPNTPIADIYTIPDQCRSKIKKQTDSKVTTINFRKDTCDPVISPNATFVTHEFALRNRRPAIDPYASDIQIDRRVYIDFRFKCVYPLLNKPVVLPTDITALHRSIFVSLKPSEDPLKVTMSAFRDEDFTVPITTNDSSVMIPDPVWIRVTHNGRETAVIDIPSCWLDFPGEGTVETISIFIVLDGCPFKENNGTGSLDGAHNLDTCSSNVASFMFYSFSYTNNSLHIECDVDVYEDVPRVCNQRVCGSSGSSTRRRRRNAPGKIGLDIQPRIRECNECRGYCKCDGVCGCDNTGKPKCFCRNGRVVTEE